MYVYIYIDLYIHIYKVYITILSECYSSFEAPAHVLGAEDGGEGRDDCRALLRRAAASRQLGEGSDFGLRLWGILFFWYMPLTWPQNEPQYIMSLVTGTLRKSH